VSAFEYICIECGLREVDAPLEVHYCRWCSQPCHPRCKPDHECRCYHGLQRGTDPQGFDAVQRFDLLRGYFLSETTRAAISATDQGPLAARACRFDTPLGELHRAIQRAVDHAVAAGRTPQSVTFADVEKLLPDSGQRTAGSPGGAA